MDKSKLMLSYQHIYHAGNLADVQKHSLLCWMLDYLTRKDKPMSYIETHAGRALYDLSSNEAAKTGEAEKGIELVLEDWFAPEHAYRRQLDLVKLKYGEASYAGSPLLAAGLLRPSDQITLCELHPREFIALRESLSDVSARIVKKDGLETALSLCPPTPRRGLLLIDPSYEVKSDYDAISKALPALHRKWNVGVIALWYPILINNAQAAMVARLKAKIPDAFLHEVRFPPARDGHKMIGSGMFIVNPPFGIEGEAKRLSQLYSTL